MQELATKHVSSFNILQGASHIKSLGQFYKILTVLWINQFSRQESQFRSCLEQLEPTLTQTIQASPQQLTQESQTLLQLMRHVHILLGIAQGMSCSEDFKLYYNWLSPYVFGFLNKILDVFVQNDQVALMVFKLLAELANNRSHRFSNFSMKTTNCLVIFKESAEMFMKYFQG